jgi:hypothetical protein
MFGLTGSFAGAAIAAFTTPTYTMTADQGLDARSKQSYISTIGGTQAGVTAHTLNAPFTVTVRRPAVIKTLSMAFLNGVTGQYSRVPYNDWLVLWRKGAQVAANQWHTNEVRTLIHIAAGSETFDVANVRGLLSAAGGYISANAQGASDSVQTGVM